MSTPSTPTGLTRWVPRLMVALTTAHFIAAFSLYDWPGMLGGGWFDLTVTDPPFDDILWFFIGGVGMIGLIALARLGVRTEGRIPLSVGVCLLLAGVPLTLFQPVSGGAFAVVIGVLAIVATVRSMNADPATDRSFDEEAAH